MWYVRYRNTHSFIHSLIASWWNLHDAEKSDQVSQLVGKVWSQKRKVLVNLRQFLWNCSTIKLFLKLGVIDIHDMNIKKCNKGLGSPCFFTRQPGDQAFKMGYFHWLRVKSLNYLHAEFSSGYLGDTKFYLKSKAFFIDISSIASVKLFLIAWLLEYCTFRTVPWSSWSPRRGQNTPTVGNYFPKNRVRLSNFFSSSNMFFIRLFLAHTRKKNGGHRAR